MSDNDNVTYLRPRVAPPTQEDLESLNYFLEGATEYAAYQDSEAFSTACMNGILKAAGKKLGNLDDNINGDCAVIAVMIQGMFMRQAGVHCPEINLLDDIREVLTRAKKDESE
jgi:hypothetical protein